MRKKFGVLTWFEQYDFVQQILFDRIDLSALDDGQRVLEQRGLLFDVQRSKAGFVFLVQQGDVGLREILGGRQNEQFVPTVSEQFEL